MQRVLYCRILYTYKGIEEKIDLSQDQIEKLIFKASLCGLLHDISHCAFGHTADRLLVGLIKDKKEDDTRKPKSFDKRMFGRIIEVHFKHLIEPHFRMKDIISIVTGQTDELDDDADPWDTFISLLINSDADMDRLDFLPRDAFFAAEPAGALNVPALIDAVRPWKDKEGRIYMTFSEDFMSLVEDLVLARDLMYLRCYDSPSKLVGEWLATRSLSLVLKKFPELNDRLDSFALLTDSQIPELLSSCSSELSEAGEILQTARGSGALAFQEVVSVPLS